jgi:hypothetical protein
VCTLIGIAFRIYFPKERTVHKPDKTALYTAYLINVDSYVFWQLRIGTDATFQRCVVGLYNPRDRYEPIAWTRGAISHLPALHVSICARVSRGQSMKQKIEQRSMVAEMGVGPSRPFWAEVEAHRNGSCGLMEYGEAAPNTSGRTASVFHCIPPSPASTDGDCLRPLAVWKERTRAAQPLRTGAVYLPRSSVALADILKLRGAKSSYTIAVT